VRLLRTTVLVALLAAVAAPAALALRFTDDSYFVPKGIVGRPYTHWFKGDAGCGPGLPYQFRIIGGELPPGLWLRTDGLLGGTPTEAGSWSFWVELSDQDPPTQDWCRPAKSQREFTVVVVKPLEIDVPSAPASEVGVSLAPVPLRATGGFGARTWRLEGVLPPGVRFDAPRARIVGTPARAGVFRVKVVVTDEAESESGAGVTLVVRPRLAIATKRLPAISVGGAFHARVRSLGGVGAVRFRVVSGRFPVGVRLDVATGVLTGTPRKPGVYRFAVQARDTLGVTSTQRFVLTVRSRRR
jgi:hypothetical protein